MLRWRPLAPLLRTQFFLVRELGWDSVAASQPSAQIDIRAAPRTKWAILLVGRFRADRAAHGSASLKGRRSRFRFSSRWPSGVHPARLVSIGSP